MSHRLSHEYSSDYTANGYWRKKVHLVAKTHHEVDLEVYSLLMFKYLLVPAS